MRVEICNNQYMIQMGNIICHRVTKKHIDQCNNSQDITFSYCDYSICKINKFSVFNVIIISNLKLCKYSNYQLLKILLYYAYFIKLILYSQIIMDH